MKTRAAIEPLEFRIAPAVLFAVEVDTNKLVSFDSAAPGTLLTDVAITGIAATEVIAGIDFDPTTGRLLALAVADNGASRTTTLYSLDPVSGAATRVGNTSASGIADTGALGFDINPLTGVAHYINSADGNHTTDGTTIGTATNVDDPAVQENITAIAFDRPFGSSQTTMYGYNFITDQLVTIGDKDGSPLDSSSGVVKPIAIAKLGGVNFSSLAATPIGFDIGGSFGGSELGWMALNTSTNAGRLYNIDLATAALTDLGAIGNGTRKFAGLTVQPDAAAPAISLDGKTATWTDLDGDAVTLKITQGVLTAASFRMLAGTGASSALSKLTLTDPAFTGTSVTLNAKPGAAGGDGRVNIGAIDATGVDLGAVKVPGDIVAIFAGNAAKAKPGVKSLSAASWGAFGLGPLPGLASVASTFTDGVGKLSITGDFYGSLDLGEGKSGSIFIGGDVIGGTAAGDGKINNGISGTVAKAVINGSIRTVDAGTGGNVRINATGSFTLGGSIIGGPGAGAGSLIISGAASGKTLVSIGGDILGSPASGGGGTYTGTNVGTLKIGGSLIGGGNIFSGGISVNGNSNLSFSVAIKGSLVGGTADSSGSIMSDGVIKNLAIGGSVTSTGKQVVIAAKRFGSVQIGGNLAGVSNATGSPSVLLTASGVLAPKTAAESVAIGKLTIGGDARHAVIGAGLDSFASATTADSAIGAIKIGRDFIASSVVASLEATNGVFGDGDDFFYGSGGNAGNPAIKSTIASVTIGGQLRGTIGGTDRFGIIAEQIGAIIVNKFKLPLTTNKDDFVAGFTADVRVREIIA